MGGGKLLYSLPIRPNYTKACYTAIREAKDSDDLNNRIEVARSCIEDPLAWREYLSNRGLVQPKRKPGRPKLPDHLKRQNPRIKRSDQMRALLLEHNIVVDEHDAIIGYEDFTFLPNARIRTPENDVISAIQFMHDYV